MKRFWQWPSMIILCVMTSALFLGCASPPPPPMYVSLVLTTVKIRPSIALEEVKVYADAGNVPGKYEKVGIITAHGDYQATDLAAMYEAMRVEAAKSGANGVILDRVREAGPGNRISHTVHAFIGQERTRKATAIYVFPEKLP